VAVDPRWLRTPDDRVAVAEGCTFDEAAGAFVAEFFETFLRHSKGNFADQPFTLLPWQRDFIDRLYGWKRPDGSRRFREGYLEVPKKNGKSSVTGGLELLHLVADGERGAEVYTGALDGKQAARTIFRTIEAMIDASPELKSRLEVIPTAKRVVYPATRSFLEVLTADAANKEGYDISFACIDELHVQPTPDLYHTLRYGGAARRQPLFFSITTAGEDRESICYQIRETARQINEGLVSDTTFLGVIYAAEDGDDYEDPAVWRKANPSMGHMFNEETFGRELKAASRNDSDWRSFLRYRLNVWIAAVARFLNRLLWDACAAVPVREEDLDGQPCYAGLDLASTTDLAAFAAIFDGGQVLMRHWTPEATVLERSRRDRVDYQGWIRAGLIAPSPGHTIDYDRIKAEVLAFHARHPIKKLLVDPWNATQISTQLANEGIEVATLPQVMSNLTRATKELERMVLEGRLLHGNNPVLNWQADNAAVITDTNENKRLSKKSSRQRIDGMAALVNAVEARMAGGDGGGAACNESPLVIL
jgi:phage terminase large subunit-like protein